MTFKPFRIAVAYFILIIVISHFYAPAQYEWTKNTISDLASQGESYKWIMQAGFIGFGAILILGVEYHFIRNRHSYFLFLIALYGLSILMSGIYCAAPINPSIPYSISEANLHSMFATVAGLGMTLGIFWQVLASSNNHERQIRIGFLLLVGGISGLFGLAENHILNLDKGIIQRILYLTGLAWLVYEEQLLSARKKISNERK